MSGSTDFLSRWSRRKREADRRAADARPPAPDGPEAPAAADGDAVASPPADAVALSPEELAELPRIEDLTPETDLAGFLRAGVPAALRKEALRRMWSLDPAIRDFVGEARDYSYDWNVAGGVPVSGPLLPGDDVEATLGRMFTRLRDDPVPEEPSRAPAGREAVQAGGEVEPCALGRRDEALPPRPASGTPAAEADVPAAQEGGVPGGGRSEETAVRPPSPPAKDARRHGSAIPKFD